MSASDLSAALTAAASGDTSALGAALKPLAALLEHDDPHSSPSSCAAIRVAAAALARVVLAQQPRAVEPSPALMPQQLDAAIVKAAERKADVEEAAALLRQARFPVPRLYLLLRGKAAEKDEVAAMLDEAGDHGPEAL